MNDITKGIIVLVVAALIISGGPIAGIGVPWLIGVLLIGSFVAKTVFGKSLGELFEKENPTEEKEK